MNPNVIKEGSIKLCWYASGIIAELARIYEETFYAHPQRSAHFGTITFYRSPSVKKDKHFLFPKLISFLVMLNPEMYKTVNNKTPEYTVKFRY